MDKVESPQRWFHPWRRHAPVVQDDPADLGTAFGLDMSMTESEAASPPSPAAERRGWVRRLATRRGPAA